MIASRQLCVAVVACLALVACGEQPARDVPAATPTPSPTPAFAAKPLDAFPPPLRGRWGLVAADCEPGRDDAKGLMEIAATSLRFYESRATMTGLRQTAERTFEATLAFSGEGQTWSHRETLTLGPSDGTIDRVAYAEPAVSRDHYTRCPPSQPR